MDDLIKRLGIIARAEMSNYAERTVNESAAALTEAHATIARQQVMLDRSLEDAGEKMVEIARLREALREIIDASNNAGIEMGTVGMRVAERVEDIACAALSSRGMARPE